MASHTHDHDPSVLSEPEARVRALETILTEKGYVDQQTLDLIVDQFESRVGPHIGARIVAKAWSDPAFHQRLIKDATEAVNAAGQWGRLSYQLVALPNTGALHHMVVCTLCSCYPVDVLGLPPSWYKSEAYRSRAVLEPRRVLSELGLDLPASTEIRVFDSTADTRYLVIPTRPEGASSWTEEELAELVTRDSMVGAAQAKTPSEAAP